MNHDVANLVNMWCYFARNDALGALGLGGADGEKMARALARMWCGCGFVVGAGDALAGGRNESAGQRCLQRESIGVLHRRHVRVERIVYIGRESNRLEEIEAGIIHSPESVYTEYPDPSRDEWETKILPVLKENPDSNPNEVQRAIPFDAATHDCWEDPPRRRNRQQLEVILRRLGIL